MPYRGFILLMGILTFFTLLVLLMLEVRAEAQQVEEAVIGTFSNAPSVPVVPPTGGTNLSRPLPVVGPVVTFPTMEGYPVDWATLRANRLAEVALMASTQLFFSFDSSELQEQSEAGITALAELLHNNPDVGLVVTGHTDRVGEEDYNFRLGLERAEAVRLSLYQQGIELSRVRTQSLGESAPAATLGGASPDNRRVEITTFDLFSSN